MHLHYALIAIQALMSFVILLKLYLLELASVADRDTIIFNMHIVLGFTLLCVFFCSQ